MKKVKVYLSLLAIILVMNSCFIYSLFPIYTEDTLVYLPELEGKWQMDEGGNYLLFESNKTEENTSESETVFDVYTDSIVTEDFTIRYNAETGMMLNGKVVYDKDSMKAIYEGIFNKIQTTELEESVENSGLENGQRSSFSGSYSYKDQQSYTLSVVEDTVVTKYLAHLTKIGSDLFLDLYPEEINATGFGPNMFPVHSFMKVELKKDELLMTFFNSEKLINLFESNLIRLRHENVDGEILITAQPKEIRSFLDKYADDESVFEDTESYQRVKE